MIKESRYLKKREKIRKRRSFFRIIRGILYISLIILSILSLLKFLETSPYFYIKDIRISGSMHYSDNVIIEAFNLNKDSNIFNIDLDNVKEKLLKLSWISDVKIKRSLLRTIEVEIKERIPVAVVNNKDSFFFLDRDCYILDEVSKYSGVNLPIIKDLDIEEINIGDKLEIDGLDEITYIFNDLGEDLKRIVSHFIISKGLNISLFTKDNIEIIFGNSESLFEKQSAALEIYNLHKNREDNKQNVNTEGINEESEKLENQLKVIDVRVWTNPITIP